MTRRAPGAGRPITSKHPRAAYWRNWKQAKRNKLQAQSAKDNDIPRVSLLREYKGRQLQFYGLPRLGYMFTIDGKTDGKTRLSYMAAVDAAKKLIDNMGNPGGVK